jgi:hypothetical protein
MWLALFLLLFQTQPVPYSHKVHLALGLECKNCHKNPDPGEVMGIPQTPVCMGCHSTVKKDSPAIQKLAGFHESKKPVPWVRVYQVPGYVFFNHRAHLAAKGVTCQTCHGPVAERDVLTKEKDISMGACMDCHQKNNASNSCTFCHDERTRGQ